MQVFQIMSQPAVSVGPDTPVREIARLLLGNRISGVPVVDADNRPIGMVVGTFLAVFFVPMFFVVVRRVFKSSARERERFAEHAAQAGITAEAAHAYVNAAEEGLSEEERRSMHEGADTPPANGAKKDAHE